MVYKYAVFSNFVVSEPNFFNAVASYLKSEKFDGVIINGDFSGQVYSDGIQDIIGEFKSMDLEGDKSFNKGNSSMLLDKSLSRWAVKSMAAAKLSDYDYVDYMGDVVGSFAKSNLEVFVSPGVGDDAGDFKEAISFLTSHYANVFDCSKNPVISRGDHELVFVPGQIPEDDNHLGVIIDSSVTSRNYVDEREQLVMSFNPYDVIEKVRDPTNSLLFVSQPPLFDNEVAVDYEVLWQIKEDFVFRDEFGRVEEYEKGFMIFDEFKELFSKQGAILEKKGGNVGSDLLRIIYENSGFNKLFVNFPSNIGAMHNWRGKELIQGKFYEGVVSVPSLADALLGGVLRYESGRVAVSSMYLGKPVIDN